MFSKCSLSTLCKEVNKPIDVFIGFCSFDPRCLSVISNIDIDLIKTAIIYVNEEMPEETIRNLNTFHSLLNDKIREEKVKVFNPIQFTDSVLKTLAESIDQNKTPQLFVDITSFTHEGLMIIYAILKEKYKDAQVVYAYNNAKLYASEAKEKDERWLSRGIEYVRSVLGYAGEQKSSLDYLLIVLLGYESERACRMIAEICPDKLLIMHNDKSCATSDNSSEAVKNYDNLIRELETTYPYETQIISSNDPFSAIKTLNECIITNRGKYNIILLPMNNKLNTLAAAQVAMNYPEVQVCYAPAIIYNTKQYAVPGENCYLVDFENKGKGNE